MVPDKDIFPKMDANMADDSIVAPMLPITTIEILSPSQALSELNGQANFYIQVRIKSGCLTILMEEPERQLTQEVCCLKNSCLRGVYFPKTVFSIKIVRQPVTLDVLVPLCKLQLGEP